MLAYFLALITIAALKYKVYGFAFQMLVGLAIEVLAILIVAGLTFSIVKLNENGVSIKSTEIVNRAIGLTCV